MYRCGNCGCEFEEWDAAVIHDTFENYNGVGSMFPNSNEFTYHACPQCGSDDLEEFDEEEEEEDEGE